MNLYPSLNRFFKNQTELAHAGCMSRRRLFDCLSGTKDFTRAEKKAISANIVVKILTKDGIEDPIDYASLSRAVEAYQGKFDEVFKAKE